MGRIRENVRIEDRDCWTLFDSGARNSYITKNLTDGLVVVPLKEQRSFALGGKAHSIDAACLVQARVEGHPVEFHANVTDEIGKDEDGKPIEMLFGAIAMLRDQVHSPLCDEHTVLDIYHQPLTIGQPLPLIPLYLKNGPCLQVDLPGTYEQTRQSLRIP